MENRTKLKFDPCHSGGIAGGEAALNLALTEKVAIIEKELSLEGR